MRRILTEAEEFGKAIDQAVMSDQPEAGPDFAAITTDMDRDMGEPDDVGDRISFNASSLIRMMEHCREDFMGEDADNELHEFAELLISKAKERGADPINVEDLEDMFEEEQAEAAAEGEMPPAAPGGEMGGEMPPAPEGEEEEGGEEESKGPPPEVTGEKDEEEEDEEEGEEKDEDEEEDVEEGKEKAGNKVVEAKGLATGGQKLMPGKDKTTPGAKTDGIPKKIDNVVGKDLGMKKTHSKNVKGDGVA